MIAIFVASCSTLERKSGIKYSVMAFHADHFYLNLKEPNQSCLLALRSIILNHDRNITEAIKWGIPCFSFKKEIFCFLNVDKRTNQPYILFVEGKHLDHPKLEIGNRTRMKVLKIKSDEDIPIHDIKLLLTNALGLYESKN